MSLEHTTQTVSSHEQAIQSWPEYEKVTRSSVYRLCSSLLVLNIVGFQVTLNEQSGISGITNDAMISLNKSVEALKVSCDEIAAPDHVDHALLPLMTELRDVSMRVAAAFKQEGGLDYIGWVIRSLDSIEEAHSLLMKNSAFAPYVPTSENYETLAKALNAIAQKHGCQFAVVLR